MSLANLSEDDIRNALIGSNEYTDFHTNYFVEAGAGAGKTWILVRRIVAQLLSKTYTPDQIVAITFTEAATKQLKEALDEQLLQRLAAAPAEEKPFIQELHQQLEQMQISTVHSFCQTMLQSMPFKTELGMEMTLVEKDQDDAEDFYLQAVREHPTLFPQLRALGLRPESFSNTFLTIYQMLDINITIATDPGVPKIKTIAQSLHANLLTAFAPLRSHSDWGLLNPDLTELLDTTTLSNDQALRLAFFCLTKGNQLPMNYSDAAKEFSSLYKNRNKVSPPPGYIASHPLFDLYDGLNKAWKDNEELSTVAAAYVHAHAMPTLLDLAREYQAQKAARHVVSFSDLLTKTRDMLQRQPQARAYFKDRYRTIYVDEFQDTDPVQTQILFYLTAETFDPQWDKCVPRPGSLFLVGDPKQSIYRFTGADIQIYNKTQALFQNGVGEVVVLRNNYRSDAAICSFVDGIFDPRNYQPKYTKRGTLAAKQPENPTFCGGAYQANYTSMHATNGSNGRTLLWNYTPEGDTADELRRNDPKHVAAFIYTAVANKMQVGAKTASGATYGDFMILLPKNGVVKDYMVALSALGIPCQTAGNRTLKDVPPIQRGLLHLESLANPTSNLLLSHLLVHCYQVSLRTLRRFLHLASTRSLTQIVASAKLLDTVQAQLTTDPKDAPLLKLCAVCRELAFLRQQAQAFSPMALLELLFDGGFGLYAPQDDYQRKNDYALVQQFLMGVRKKTAGNLTQLLAIAQDYCTTTIGRQLPLTHAENQVKIMTVHKSKGLEANVIILGFAFDKSPSIYHRMDRTTTPPSLHVCLTKKAVQFRSDDYVAPTVVGEPPHWSTHKGEESNFAKAEAIRLLYVAATRAKTSLVICQTNRSHWKHLLEPGLTTIGTDPAYVALQTAKIQLPATATPSAVSVSAPAVTPQPLNTFALEQTRQAKVAPLLEGQRFHITPSALEHAPDAPKAPTAPNLGTTKKAPPKPPFGPTWGDIIHRTMELIILGKDYSQDARTAHTQRAISEVLPSEILSKDQSFPLLGKSGQLMDADNRRWLQEQAVAATQFIENPSSPFTQLLTHGIPYPEMNFFIALTQGELYDHLAAHIGQDDVKGKSLDANGSIDLAVLTPQGWVVVDYKTDRIKSGEDEAAYCKRLTAEYTNQISAYGKLLETLDAGCVVGLYLCSIPLGGKLISLMGPVANP